MNESSYELARAKQAQSLRYVTIVVSVVMIVVVVCITVLLMRGVLIQVMPDDAAVNAVVRVESGPGFSFNDTIYAFSNAVTVSVQAVGFRARLVGIADAKAGSLLVELTELPARLEVTATGSGDKTRWWVDGELVSIGPAMGSELLAGEHKFTVDDPYHIPQELTLDLGRGELRKLEVSLEEVAGSIQLNSNPPGAEVLMDGHPKGVTPLVIETKGGVHPVVVSYAGYEDIVERIAVTSDVPAVSRDYVLQRRKAHLGFELVPRDGVLLVNGSSVKDPANVVVNANEAANIEFSKTGFGSISRQVVLEPGESRTIQLSLSQQMGQVQIKSAPSAHVSIGGKDYGSTPLTLSLPVFKQNIMLSLDGYRSVEKVVTPSVTSPKQIVVQLVPELDARLAEAKPMFRNSVGMEFKLIKPTSVHMGAPRSEPGQRANEFERNVELSKPFYVSLHEVTVDQFSAFHKGAGGQAGNLPVVSVGWEDAARFCNWLSHKEGLSPFYLFRAGAPTTFNPRSDGYRMPTEAEWEWLARMAGRRSQTRFTWGDKFVLPAGAGNIADESAKSAVSMFVPGYDDGFAAVAPVGSFGAESSGLSDLTGNVSEWVHDYYSLVPPKAGSVERNPMGDATGSGHVIKGSNWKSASLTELRASFRDVSTKARDDTGFRLARYLYGAEK